MRRSRSLGVTADLSNRKNRVRIMAEIAMDLRSSHRAEPDGTHTVTVEMTGLPTIEMAQGVSNWMRDLVRANAHKIGRLEAKPQQGPAPTRPENTSEVIEQARVFVREKPSTSYLQRRMQIGYNRAADIMEFFEAEGMISAPSASGVRTLLR